MLDAITHDHSCSHAILTRSSYRFSSSLTLHNSGKRRYIHKNGRPVGGNVVPNQVPHNYFIIYFWKSDLTQGSRIHKTPVHMAHIPEEILTSCPRCKTKNSCNKGRVSSGTCDVYMYKLFLQKQVGILYASQKYLSIMLIICFWLMKTPLCS